MSGCFCYTGAKVDWLLTAAGWLAGWLAGGVTGGAKGIHTV